MAASVPSLEPLSTRMVSWGCELTPAVMHLRQSAINDSLLCVTTMTLTSGRIVSASLGGMRALSVPIDEHPDLEAGTRLGWHAGFAAAVLVMVAAGTSTSASHSLLVAYC